MLLNLLVILILIFTYATMLYRISSTNHKYINELTQGFWLCFSVVLYFCLYIFPVYWYLYCFLAVVVLVVIVYMDFYGYLGLNKTLLSFFCFFANISILVFYLFVSFLSIFIKSEEPLYLENISVLSKWRYVILVLLCIFGGLLYLIALRKKKLSDFLQKLEFPNLHEEVRKVTDTIWYDEIGYYFKKLDKKLHVSKMFRIFYFTCAFILFYVYRIFILLIFINFIFFHGDLHFLLQWIPVSFFFWLLGFIFYHHMWYIQGNFNHLNDLIQVSPITNTSFYETKNEILKTSNKNLSVLPFEFKLTLEGYNKGYRENLDLEKLIPLWFELRMLINSYVKYKKYTLVLSLIIFSISFFCWCYISIIVLKDVMCLGFPWGVFTTFFNKNPTNTFHYRNFHSTTPGYARDARRIPESSMGSLRQKTSGAYSPGHFVVGELQADGTFKAQGCLTSKSQIPNAQIVPKKITDNLQVNGDNKPQYYIPFSKEVILLPGEFFITPFGISVNLFSRPDVMKALEDAHKET